MKILNVLSPFKLNLAEVMREFEAGIQEVEDDIADHWFTKANSEALTAKQAKALQADPAPVVDTPETPADAPATDQPA